MANCYICGKTMPYSPDPHSSKCDDLDTGEPGDCYKIGYGRVRDDLRIAEYKIQNMHSKISRMKSAAADPKGMRANHERLCDIIVEMSKEIEDLKSRLKEVV